MLPNFVYAACSCPRMMIREPPGLIHVQSFLTAVTLSSMW